MRQHWVFRRNNSALIEKVGPWWQRRILFFLLLVVLSSAGIARLPADEPDRGDEQPEGPGGPEQPEDTDIILPSEILQVEDVDMEVVEAPLPDFAEPEIPDVGIPLPEPEEMEITQAALDLDPAAPDSTVDASGSEERSLYSTGRVAVGTRNHLIGELGVFSVGEEPSFNMQFSHESIDGFQQQAPGTGFLTRRDRLAGELDTEAGEIGLSTDGTFEVRSDGLQRQSPDFSSIDQRYFDGTIDSSWSPTGPLSVSLSGDADYAGLRFATTGDNDSVSEIADRFAGESQAVVSLDSGEVGLIGTYETRSSEDRQFLQVLSGGLQGEYTFAMPLVLNAKALVSWNTVDGPLFPFELGAAATVEDVFNVDISGGFRALRPSLTDIWREVPVAGNRGQKLSDGRQWFADARLNWLVTSAVTIDANAEFTQTDNAVDFDGFDPDTARHPIIQTDIQQLRSDVSVSWSPRRWLRLSGGHVARFLGRRSIDPVQEFNAEAELTTEEQRAGVRLDSSLPVFSDGPSIPIAGVTGFASVTDGVELSLSLQDMLSPAAESPRYRYSAGESSEFPFIEPGIRATLSARLTL
ncbi:MAG: hypothetical protein ACLFM0_01635 [Spirochaetales bacterium]